MSEDESKLKELIEEEKKKELSKALSEGETEPVIEEEIPTYLEVYAEMASKKLGVSKESILRAVKDLVSTEGKSIKKLAKLNQISRILNNLRSMGGLTSEVTDLSMARLASKVTDKVSESLLSDDDMGSFLKDLKKTMLQIMLLKEITKAFREAMGSEQEQVSRNNSNDEMLSTVMSMISSLEDKLNKITEEVKSSKVEKSFMDRIKETIDSAISTKIDSIEKKFNELSDKLRALEEEKKKKEQEEMIQAIKSEISSLRDEMSKLQKITATGTNVNALPTKAYTITDLISEYKEKMMELDKAKKELDEMISKVREGKSSRENNEVINELKRLRDEITELKKKADMTDVLKDLASHPEKINKWVDTAVGIVNKVSALKNAFVGTNQGTQQVATEEPVEPPKSVLDKLLSEEEEKHGEEESAGEEVSEGGEEAEAK